MTLHIRKQKATLIEQKESMQKDGVKIDLQLFYLFKVWCKVIAHHTKQQLASAIDLLMHIVQQYKLQMENNLNAAYLCSLQERITSMRIKLKFV